MSVRRVLLVDDDAAVREALGQTLELAEFDAVTAGSFVEAKDRIGPQFEGVIVSDILMEKGVKSVALTYTNNDYGKGLADSFQAAYEDAGGSVTINAAHEDGKADYSAEVGALAAAGAAQATVSGGGGALAG